MKKTIALLSALTMVTAFVGCSNSEVGSSSEANSTTTVTETSKTITTNKTNTASKEKFILDKTYDYHDITFEKYSCWGILDKSVFVGMDGFNCPKIDGWLFLEFDQYDDAKICNSMLEFHIDTYHRISDSTPQTMNVKGVDINMFYWKSDSGYEKTYIFAYNNCIYKIEFASTSEHYETCSMFQNSDDVINSITFNNLQTTESQTEFNTESTTAVNTDSITEPITSIVEESIEDVSEEQGITVYVTPTGKKYHYDNNCNGGSYSPTDLDSALRRGLEPCKKCT